ncbi:MAG: HEAT repeat domain-containing protein [Deltaproteobacteria bacterium]
MNLNQLENTPPWEWPESAGQTIRTALANRKGPADHRMLAAQLAGDYIVASDAMVKALLGVLSDGTEPTDLRSRAAIALGPSIEGAEIDGFDDPELQSISRAVFDDARRILRKLYSDQQLPLDVRRRVLEAAVRAPEDWQVEAARTAAASDEQAWRLTAVFCMRFVKGFDAQIMAALGSDDVEIQREAVQAAGAWSMDAAWKTVVGMVMSTSTPKDTRIAAIEAVVSIRPGAARELLEELRDSDDADIASAVEDACGEATALEEFESDED